MITQIKNDASQQTFPSISFIGAGNMAQAIFSRLLDKGYPAQKIMATRTTQAGCDELIDKYGIGSTLDNQSAVNQADVVILAVKPQMMAEVCRPFQSLDLSDKLIISIAAGIQVHRLYEMLGQEAALIRIMPNTPSLIGLGMSGMYAGHLVKKDQKDFTDYLMGCVGRTCWVEQEAHINHIIAAAGSAPAYFFLFMQAMENKAIDLGFSAKEARLLVEQSALGAASMVVQSPDLSLAKLRQQVSSKGGATQEAIESFMTSGLEDIVAKAMQATITKAEQMENEI